MVDSTGSIAAAPLFQCLEFKRVSRQIGNVECCQNIFRRFRVVISRATDERESGERDDHIDRGATVPQKKFLDRRARIEPG